MSELNREDLQLGLKEPIASKGVSRAVVSVLGEDKVGIIATLSGIVAEHNGNIVEINQNIVGELFAMIMVVELNRSKMDFGQFKAEMEKQSDVLGLTITVQSENVFRYMHRI